MKKTIHWTIMKMGRKHYICNQATSITEEKTTDYHSKVTCKNCLRILEKMKRIHPDY